MTREEFSNSFDLLLNSYIRFKDFDNKENMDSIDLNEYEKSVFLTKAQEQIVEELYTGRNLDSESYEETEKLRRYLSDLNREEKLEPVTDYDYSGISEYSKFFELPYRLRYITYETVKVSSDDCWNGRNIEVIPVKQDWYNRQAKNPFRGISSRRALRLDMPGNVVEIVYPLDIEYYYIRYIIKPLPIVLEDLPNNLTIDDIGNATDCTLHEALHQKILDRAVMIALQRWGVSMPQKK